MADVNDIITVRVGRIPGKIQEIGLHNGFNNVKGALDAAGITIGGADEVKVNGNPATLEDDLRNSDNVYVVERIRGA
jgi:hypothetical protein